MNAREKTRMYAAQVRAKTEAAKAAGLPVPQPITQEEIDARHHSEEEKMWRKQLKSVENQLRSLLERADDLEVMLDVDFDTLDDKSERKVDNFIRKCASTYQSARKLHSFERIFIEKKVKPNSPDLEKSDFYFPHKLEKQGNIYAYTLPELCNKRASAKPFGELKSKLLIEVLRSMHEKYIDEHGYPELIHPAALVFEHHLDRNLSSHFVQDPDNIDVKTVIDEAQLFVISNDSLRDITLFHLGVDDEESYTKFYIMPKDEFPIWIAKQENFANR